MAVRVTEDCSVHYNYGLHPLKAGEVIPDGEFAAHLLASKAPVEVVGAEQTPPPVVDEDAPAGTVADVLDWVDRGVRDRAAAALEAENASDRPRSTLVAELEKRAAGEVGGAEDQG